MALVRILVDGFSLLHNWPELAAGKPRYSAAAREALIQRLTQYHDACRIPVTIVFDGAGKHPGPGETPSSREVEILYSRSGQTADQIIERVATRLAAYGEVLVVTDDNAERDLVRGVGGQTQGCLNFVTTVENALRELEGSVALYNRRERERFRRPR